MVQYEIGDSVKVIEDTNGQNEVGAWCGVPCGTTGTISEVVWCGTSGTRYRVDVRGDWMELLWIFENDLVKVSS